MGSFEIVKTTSIKTPQSNQQEYVKPPSAPSAFYAGSLLSTGDSELGYIAEEFDADFYMGSQTPVIETNEEEEPVEPMEQEENLPKPEFKTPLQEIKLTETTSEQERSPRTHAYRQLTQRNNTRRNESLSPVRSILKNKSPPVSTDEHFLKPRKVRLNDNDSNSGDSLYSDAYDSLPSNSNGRSTRSVIRTLDKDDLEKTRPRRGSNTSSTRKSVRIDAPQKKNTPPVKVEMTQEQMYLKALEIARLKVYGTREAEDHESVHSGSSFKREFSNNSPAVEEFKFTMRDPQASLRSNGNGGRAMSMTSRVSNDNIVQTGPGFRSHSLRSSDLHPIPGRRITSVIHRSPSKSALDKKTDKKVRKEELKQLEIERKDAMELASQQFEAHHSSVESSPVKKPATKSKSRFSIFSKKAKKDPVPSVVLAVVATEEAPLLVPPAEDEEIVVKEVGVTNGSIVNAAVEPDSTLVLISLPDTPPTLTYNHPDENVSEPKTLEPEDEHPPVKDLQYQDYTDINERVTTNKRDSQVSQDKKATLGKKKGKKSFGKKMMKWFDVES